ncbi:UNVERIFIED_CONTAM: hypothetical protein PYX00_004170 [Menopon gallinae]|uniref:Nucleoporin Nup54 alpha-helical domain-containing protein n=1 Tax=Menopon gallinae TaxID=328185 RepID=A0AAW2I593_9NEOP
MSFGFSNTSVFPSTSTPSLAFSSTATTKPSGFGTSLFTTPASTGTSFGLGTTTTTSSTGFSFGASTSTPFGTGTSTFGSTGSAFGSTGTSTTGFGATNTGFGGTTGGFGTSTAGFGSTSGGFGTSTGLGTFGTSSTTTGLGGFGTFGSINPTSSSSGFTGLGSFGSTSTSGTGLFQGFGQSNILGTGTGLSTFGAKPATSLGWGTGTLGQQNQQPQQQIDPNQALYNAVFNCQIFGDERDKTLSRWNLVQALWGTGKGYYSRQAPPIEFDMKNPLCRFKAISYSLRPRTENKDGFVALIINKKDSQIRSEESQFLVSINNVLGNKPNVTPGIESIKPYSETKTLVIIFAQEKSATGSVRKIPASELSAFLMQPMQRQQLTNMQVENVYPQVDPGQESLKEYLDNPPPGFDATLWQQAQDDNPMPDKLIPVPLVGFAEVRWRMKCQEQETALHLAFLDKIAEEIADLQRKHTETLAKISEYRLRFSELQHRILKIMIVQEISRKMGLSLLPEEEKLKSRLESISATVNSTPFKDRLAKLTEAVKAHSKSNKEPQRYKMDSDVIADIKQFLTMEQSGMTHVIDIIQSDLADLKRMKEGMMRILQGNIH